MLSALSPEDGRAVELCCPSAACRISSNASEGIHVDKRVVISECGRGFSLHLSFACYVMNPPVLSHDADPQNHQDARKRIKTHHGSYLIRDHLQPYPFTPGEMAPLVKVFPVCIRVDFGRVSPGKMRHGLIGMLDATYSGE